MYKLVVLFLFLPNYIYSAFGQDVSGNAIIFNASLTAMAGDAVYIQGSGFGASPQVQYSFNDTNWVSLAPLSVSDQAVMIQMPIGLIRLPDMVTIQVSADGTHWSSPAYLNQARAYSFDTTQVGPGNPFRVFGRNLMFSRTPAVRLVDTADGSSHPASVNAASSTAYALTAAAPSDIQANHTYQIYVSNGYSGNAAQVSETMADATLSGRASGVDYWNLGVPWAADLNYTNNVYNIQNDSRLTQHANGAGSPGDRDAINGAIWLASQSGGGVVYLPAGNYNLYFASGCGLTLLPRVALAGAGASTTNINYGFGPAPPLGQGGYAACFGTTQGGIADITFNNVNESGQWPQSGAGVGGNEIFLKRTNWNIGTAQWVVIQDANNMTVQDSNIVQGVDPSYNGPFSVQGSTNFLLRGNSIKYVAGLLGFDGVSNGVFENNTVTRDASQPVPPWVITHVVTGNFASNLMILNNIFNVTGGTLAQRNDGETIGSESGGAVRYDEFRGTVQAVGWNAIIDNSQNFNYSSNNAIPYLRLGATLAIVAGKGAGQWATVTSVSDDGHTVFVDKPWAVLPAPGATYATFDWGAANWIIAGNSLSDNEKGIEFFDSSILDILITSNTLTNNGEILISPTEQPASAMIFNLVARTQILGNTLIDNNYLRPAAISAVPRENYQEGNSGTAIIGLEIRGNSVTGSTPNTLISNVNLDDSKAMTEGINLYWQWQTIGNFVDNGVPSILATIIQGNTLTNSSVGVELNSGDYQTVILGNATNNVGSLISDATLPGATHGSVGTVTNAGNSTTPIGSINGSGAAQMTVVNSSGLWSTELLPSKTITTINFGSAFTTVAMGDYDGDGLVDCAVYANGTFYIRPSSNPNSPYTVYFGNPTDVAMPGDYDGDGKTDVAVFRPSTGQWFFSPSSNPYSPNVVVQTQAVSSDVPLPGDYDGDGKTDFTFFRPSTGTFYQVLSSNPGVTYVSPFSLPSDVPVPGDYDGDGKTDLAVYRPSTGTWYYRPSSNPNGVTSQLSQGQPGDIPVPGDYDGDGKTDFAIWRPSSQTWYVLLTSNPGITIAIPMPDAGGSATPLSLTPNAAVKASLTSPSFN